MKRLLLLTALLLPLHAADVFPGADESSPSRSHYFSWINNTNEGATAEQTRANMDFFQWLHDAYGMSLDIYAFDAGAVDAPNYYGSPTTRKFQQQFPQGFGPLADRAAGFGGRLGVWLGPDGFGDTAEEQQARIDFLASLCRDHRMELFKMDAVCGQLRDEKQPAFIELMKACRAHCPDLIVLNHRLNLGKAEPYVTTFLWEGAETYIDVHMANRAPAPHHRAAALQRGLPPQLKRLAEDHGVCLSSCLDYWADDLVLQAFNRCMILAPQLYGSPFFLRDDEYPRLARIFHLHRKYRDILVSGQVLPEETYGPHAVSRGDDTTRLVTLRNLSWEPVTYQVALGSEIGLPGETPREVRLFHPYEEILATEAPATGTVPITVHPFRAALLLVTSGRCDEPALPDGPFRVLREIEGAPVEFEKLTAIELAEPWHRKLAELTPTELPADWEALYETTIFAADNNALELRSLERSGPSTIPAVTRARQAFLDQPLIEARGLWDRFMFDGRPDTFFDIHARSRDQTVAGGCLRVDFAESLLFDRLEIHTQAQDSTLIDNEQLGAEFSQDLRSWTAADEVIVRGSTLSIYPPAGTWRYVRMRQAPERVTEVEAWRGELRLPRPSWTGSNLFAHPAARPAVRAWSATTTLTEITPTSYLCLAIEGEHGHEGCYAALRIGDELVGAPDRAISYPSNPWENPPRRMATGYTYYFPLDAAQVGEEIEVVLLGMKDGGAKLQPTLWLTARELPFTSTPVSQGR